VPLYQGCQISFFDAKFHKFGFLEAVAVKETVWLFGFFFLIFGFFWRKLAQTIRIIRLVFWVFEYHTEKC